MSSAEVAARLVRTFEAEDLAVLRGMERALPSFEYVPLDVLARLSRVPPEEVSYRLGRLNQMGLVVRSGIGYTMPAAGLDALALHSFVRRGFLTGLGRSLGLGKEADVFEAIADDGTRYAVKFFRLGRTSFRAARKKRGYSNPLRQHAWLIQNMQAAKREFEALRKLRPLHVPVPLAVARERHALLLELIDGTLLAELSPLSDPATILRQVLAGVREAYLRGDTINADLSEYNVLHDGAQVWLIDWPQSVTRSHPNAEALLDRDLKNVLRFIERRTGLRCRLDDASAYVRGWTPRPPC